MRMSLIGAWVRGGCSDEEVRHLAVLAGVTALFLGVGTFALCACSRHWEIIFMPCVLVAAGVAVLYAAWRMGRSWPLRCRGARGGLVLLPAAWRVACFGVQ